MTAEQELYELLLKARDVAHQIEKVSDEVKKAHVMSDGLTLISDQTKAKIKTALRDAGV